RLCSLELAVGTTQDCPEEACPFWEPGGAALDGRCALEHFDVAAQSSLAEWLLEIRERLASASSTEQADVERSLFRHLLNEPSEWPADLLLWFPASGHGPARMKRLRVARRPYRHAQTSR